MTLKLTPAALAALSNKDINNFVTAATPGGIEAQEAAGQQTMVASQMLPKEPSNSRAELEQLGIKFGSDVDDLFINVELPPGWKIQTSSHSMWSDLIDDKGRKRADIFYKAAFYDRRASITLTRRYSIDAYVPSSATNEPTSYAVQIMDGETNIHTVGTYEIDSWETGDKLRDQAESWLDANHPDWENPTAYWA